MFTGPTLGWWVLDWMAEYLPSPSDPSSELILTDEQAELVLRWYAIDALTGEFLYRRGELEMAKGWGKSPLAAAISIAELAGPTVFDGFGPDGEPRRGKPRDNPWVQIAAVSEDQPLALDTVVPTPSGWTTIGDLAVGDIVIAADGLNVPVVRTTPILRDMDCYAVGFSDGERIVASASHSWTLERLAGHADRHEVVTVSTAQLAQDYRAAGGGKRYRVGTVPFKLRDDPTLPIHPYLLGLWLGVRATGDSRIAIDNRDRSVLEAIIGSILGDHERVVWTAGPGHQGTRAEVPSLRGKLHRLGVLGAKHIPVRYLRAGDAQRQALLQGLIDSGGHVTRKGRVSFTNINGRLAADVGELLTTLGYVWTSRFDGAAHRIFFTPADTRPVARLPSKAAAQRVGELRTTSVYRYVVAVEPVPSVPVRCVGLDTADRLFLVGRRAVPTHNTDNTYAAIYEMLSANDSRAAKALGIDKGRTRLYLAGRPGRLEPVTAAAGSREGQRLTFAVLDETHLWTRRNGGVRLAGTLRRNAAKMGGRTLETTNAPLLGEKSVAEQGDLTPGVMHYARRPAAEPDPGWSDEQLRTSLAEAYGDARWVDLDRIVKEIRDPATSWDDVVRYYFNIRSAGSGRAVDPRVWDALAKPRDVPAGTRIGLGFDGSISRDATVLRGCTADGYSFLVRAWVRPADAVDWTVDRTDVHQTVAETFATYDVGLMLCDPPRWWTEIDDWAERYGPERVLALDTNQARRFAPATDRWLTAIREGSHTHDGDPITDLHVKAAHLRKVRTGDEDDDGRTRYVLIKGDDRGRIDAAVADVLAHEAAKTMPESSGPFISNYERERLTFVSLAPLAVRRERSRPEPVACPACHRSIAASLVDRARRGVISPTCPRCGAEYLEAVR